MSRPDGAAPMPTASERLPDDGMWSAEGLTAHPPRIYAASLSDYNAGVLHGIWLEAGPGVETMEAGIAAMLAASPTARSEGAPAEEWRIDDVDGWGPHIDISDFDSLETIARLAEGLRAHGEAFGAWTAVVGVNDDEGIGQFEEFFIGEYASLEEFGEQQLEDMGVEVCELPGVPEGLRRYVQVDVAGWVRDMELEGAIATQEGGAGVYVFWNY